MTYVFDIDGTICTQTDGNYEDAKPFENRIKKVNELYDAGNEIIFLTARGMGRHNNNPEMANAQFWNFTNQQLKTWGVKFHNLFLGKPAAAIYIDDKGIKDTDFFNE
tara:strand:- start:1263 stop:1583 length:321 start_codon:yes stop_codon:yes gene_type:complete